MRGVARTAVVAGTATAVSHNVNRRMNRNATADAQQAQAAQQAQQPAAPTATAEQDVVAQLGKLDALYKSGTLSEAEFASAKAKLLAG